MNDFPDKSKIGKCHPFNGGNFYVSREGLDRGAAEYTRSDLCVTRADLDAAVALALERAMERMDCGCKADRTDCLKVSGNIGLCYRDGLVPLEDLIQPHQADALARVRQEAHNAAREVKPLVWEDFDGLGAKASAFYQANYLIQKWSGEGRFEVSMSYPGYQTGYDGPRWHATIEAAKAAAQADYAARIHAALALPVDGGAKG